MKLISASQARAGYAVLALLFVVLGCGKEKGAEPQAATETIADLSAISSASDRRALVGRKVDIADAPVSQVVGNYVFWAGDPHSGVPVAREDKMRSPVIEHVRRGDRVRILGVVRLLETVPDSDLLWDTVNADEKRDIQAAQVYIAAESVAIRPRTAALDPYEEVEEEELP
jgi:hypothetical protein